MASVLYQANGGCRSQRIPHQKPVDVSGRVDTRAMLRRGSQRSRPTPPTCHSAGRMTGLFDAIECGSSESILLARRWSNSSARTSKRAQSQPQVRMVRMVVETMIR